MKVTIILMIIGLWYSFERIVKDTVGLSSRRTSGDHPNYNIIENNQNTEKSLGD